MAVTQNIDVLPTVMEYYEISQEVLQYPIHGKSLLPLLRGETDKVRDSAIFGYFGKQMAWTDGKYTYFRAAKGREKPAAVRLHSYADRSASVLRLATML